MSLALLAAFTIVLLGGPARGELVHAPMGWLVAFTLVIVVGLWPLVAPLGRPSPTAGIRFGLVGIMLALPLVYALTASESAEPAHAAGFAKQAISCFSYGLLLVLPLLGVLWAIERSDRPWPWVVAGAGAASGLVANAALLLHCANTAKAHLAAGHATIGIALALGGAVVAFARARRT
jgi:hypothetical protein